MFNLIDVTSGDKIDFWLPRDTPFDVCAFSRRTRIRLDSIALPVPTPEDLVLFKMRWAHASGGSSKQMSDVQGLLHANRGTLDVTHIDRWAHVLGLDSLWHSVRPRA